MAQNLSDSYRLGRKIGAGAFGEVYRGTELKTGREVAIKLEPFEARDCRCLENERSLYGLLAGSQGIPQVHWYGVDCDCNAMVLDLLGPSLEELFRLCGRRFSLKSVLMLADQMLDLVEHIHGSHVIHRDLKPRNFLIGRGSHGSSRVYLIDFGCGKRFRDPETYSHIPYKDGKSLTGTRRYASVNTHRGVEQSRRDDLESLGYILVQFLRGKLPWEKTKANTPLERRKLMEDVKAETPTRALCKGLPAEFSAYLDHCRALEFQEKPDYSFLKGLFRAVFRREGFEKDLSFDWHRNLRFRQQWPSVSSSEASSPCSDNNEVEV